MYNNSKKDLFLKQFKEDTQEVYKRIFKKSEELEKEYNKDLYNFDEKQFEEFIKDHIKPKTKQSARTYCTVLGSYIQWAIENKYSKHNTNPLRRRSDYFYKFVNNQNNLYLSKGEIDTIIFNLVNPQDSFIIQSLFDGVQGTQLSELTGLTINDVDEDNNRLTLRDKKGNKRVLDVDKKTIKLALLANDNTNLEYYKKNGGFDYSDNIKDTVMLPKSKYVLKPTATNKEGGMNPISHYTIHNRLEMIKSLEEFEEYKESLTTKNIVRSGMIYEAKKILDRNEELDKNNIEKICEKFGIKYKWSLKDFLNEETVRDVYEN